MTRMIGNVSKVAQEENVEVSKNTAFADIV